MSRVKTATFIKSSAKWSDCPDPILPEYAFMGRSNVGKSSLINMLTNHGKLAKVSSTPGKTQLINHFLIDDNWYLVDLPGYGWAKVSKTARKKWKSMINDYLQYRENLHGVFILVDCRHEPIDSDLKTIRWMGENSIPLAIIFTKKDKLGKTIFQKNVARYKKILKQDWEELPPLFYTSSSTGEGKEEILNYIRGHSI